ncbi:MAG TPA: hypothetical protein VGM90_30280 [Kofleriaceae bacterium]|jgi:hypothetical protein
MRFLPVLALVAGCGFQVGGGAATSDDDQPNPDGASGGSNIDAAVTIEVAHVAATDEAALTSTFDWTISQPQVLDTGTMVANPPLPAGVVVKAVAQENGGPELLILQAKSIELASGVSFRVVGTHGLVLVASSQITITGTLEASADHQTAGAGGAPSGAGTGAGAQANNDTNGWDSGANGASFGAAGGKGGDVPDPHNIFASAATPPYGDAVQTLLVGGSGGGNATPLACNTKGGGGGGAVQLTAPTVTINGAIRASGGGGVGGTVCDLGGGVMDASSGGGGGAGGSIYIQAANVAGTGWLTANGGAGGGGGCQSCSGSARTGGSGENGSTSGVAAIGGTSSLNPSGYGFGGAGGASSATAENGVQGGNGGGGGGGVGRIHLTATPSNISAINASPAAQ